MTDVDVHALVAPYALDALDAVERRQFELHLAACDQCWGDVLGAMEASERLEAIRPTVRT